MNPERKRIRKTFVMQQGVSDCGVACLLSIIKFHGGDARLEYLREISGTSVKGTTLLGLYQAAQKLGLNANGLEADDIAQLQTLTSPAILHIVKPDGLKHYIIFYGFTGADTVLTGDPGHGVQEMKTSELQSLWKEKLLLTLEPSDRFETAHAEKEKKRHWLKSLIRNDINFLLGIFFLSIFISLLGLCLALFTQRLIDNILPDENRKALWMGVALVGFLLITRSGLNALKSFFFIQQGQEFSSRIAFGFYSALLRLPKSFFDSRKMGEMISRMNDTRRVQAVITMAFGNLSIDILIVFFSILFLFYYSSLFALASLALVPVFFLVSYVFNSKILKHQRAVMSSYAGIESHYIDTISGMTTIKSFNKASEFDTLNKRFYDIFQRNVRTLGKVNIRFNLIAEVITTAVTIMALGFASSFVLAKTLSLGEMMAIISILSTILPSVNRIIAMQFQFQEARVVLDRMYEFYSVPPEVRETEPSALPDVSFNELTFTNASFRFPGRRLILDNSSFKIAKDKITLMLGESGSGKSTIAYLAHRFCELEKGTISIDDVNIASFPLHELRQAVGLVQQDTKIFNGHLLYNLTLSSDPARYESALQMCERLGFNKYFESLPQGYLTLLGEEGINISGGQKQLIAIARTLLTHPKILILDESTSSLDPLAEQFVWNILTQLKSHMPILLITHRVHLSDMADIVYVLDHGKLTSKVVPSTLKPVHVSEP